MNIIENWQHWIPLIGLAEKYEIIFVSDNISDDFKIILADITGKTKEIELIFEHSVSNYRITYTKFRKKTLLNLEKQHGIDFYEKSTFFKVKNSEYLKWLSVESDTVTENINFTHYCIISPKYLIDIIIGYEPRIKHK